MINTPEWHPEPTPIPNYVPEPTVSIVSAGPSTALVVVAWIIAILTLGYMLPWAIAAARDSKNQWAVLAINLLLGWTVLGWLAALIMSLVGSRPDPYVIVS